MILELLKRSEGVLKLKPSFVHRFYPDLNRLGQRRLKRDARQFIPERWIASTIAAANHPSLPKGGLSMIDGLRQPLALRDAIRAAPEEMLGPELLAAHGGEFRVLVKLLDPGEPIYLHFHATDAQVKRMPRRFPGQRFGKDEAYYFLEVPKGPMPYTHVGLYDGVRRRDLLAAVKRGPEYALELSPPLYQQYETGFFVPAGVPHRPGTALTLEIQQLSDVSTMLATHAGGKVLPPEQIHPGFKSMEQASALIDFKVSRAVAMIDQNRLIPRAESSTVAADVVSTFPQEICRKFSGQRVRVRSRITYRRELPFAMLIWRGRGRIQGRAIRAGEEFFVAHRAARSGIEIESAGRAPLELFTFWPVP
jgi:hypothetical protein